MSTLLSFVIPCYRSEHTIRAVVDEIILTVSERSEYDYEIVCINDCSPDNVLTVLRDMASENQKIKVINLAKNVGKHAAVMAGYAHVHGAYVVNLDDDGQCPTYELWNLLAPVEQGDFDIATASYSEKKQAKWKNLGSDLNAYVGRIIFGKPKGLRFENFCIFKRFVSDEMIKYTNPFPYLEGLMLSITRRVTMVPMEERCRCDDQGGGYTLGKSIALFANGFTAFSVKPLRLSTFVGFASAAVGFIMGFIMIIRKLLNPDILTGYTSTVVLQLLIGGLILMSLGLLGEYIGRIYICINNSPQYVVREKINFIKSGENKNEKETSCSEW